MHQGKVYNFIVLNRLLAISDPLNPEQMSNCDQGDPNLSSPGSFSPAYNMKPHKGTLARHINENCYRSEAGSNCPRTVSIINFLFQGKF